MSKRDRSIANMRSEAQRIYYQRQEIKRLEKENTQIKDNWNKLKEQLKEIDNFQREFNDIPNTRMTPYDAILEIIQELERK